MSTTNTMTKLIKTLPIIMASSIIVVLVSLIVISKDTYNIEKQSLYLSSVQEASHALYQDLLILRGHLIDKNDPALRDYITQKNEIHKQWLKDIIYQQDESHEIVIFSIEYLSLIKQIIRKTADEAFDNKLALLEIVDIITQDEINLSNLSKERVVKNHQLLSKNIKNIELLASLTIIFFLFLVFSLKIRNKIFKESKENAEKLARFFIHYPQAMIRLSSRGNIRYYNKQTKQLINKLNIRKKQLIPNNISQKIDKIIANPDKTVRFQHTVNQQFNLNCDIRLCQETGQIYMMVTQTGNDPLTQSPETVKEQENIV